VFAFLELGGKNLNLEFALSKHATLTGRENVLHYNEISCFGSYLSQQDGTSTEKKDEYYTTIHIKMIPWIHDYHHFISFFT
jgi:hypothetical protein